MCGSGSPFTKVALRGFDLRGFDCGILCTLSLFAFLRKCLCLDKWLSADTDLVDFKR